MRIAVVHSFYSSSQPSGENRVVEDQVGELTNAGHDVLLVGRYTDLKSAHRTYPVRAAARVATGWGADPLPALGAFRPDVVHVHNLFPNISTRWIKRWDGPVVVSLHNYRSVCSNGLLYRQDSLCLECPRHGDASAVRHGCYRESRLATIPLAVSRKADRTRVLGGASAVITTSESSDRHFANLFGPDVPRVLIPNFGPGDEQEPIDASQRAGWVAMGRFSPEKGFVQLLSEWPDAMSLTLVGDGELRDDVRAAAVRTGVNLKSTLPIGELRTLLPAYRGLVFPSRWLEVAPQVVVEAMRVGLPVVAFDANGVAAFVEATGTGVSYGSSRSLESALLMVDKRCDEFSRSAADYYRDNWRPSVWLGSMTSLYARLQDGQGP